MVKGEEAFRARRLSMCNERQSNERQSNEWQSNERQSNEWQSNERQSNERQSNEWQSTGLTLLAASTSSITKITSLNVSETSWSAPSTLSLRSYMRSISCWLEETRARGMLMIERLVC